MNEWNWNTWIKHFLNNIVNYNTLLFRREIALKVLTSKGRDPGTYLLREHTVKHNYFVLSWIKDDDSFAHVEICQQIDGENIVYNIDGKRTFKDLNELQEHYKNEENRVINWWKILLLSHFPFFYLRFIFIYLDYQYEYQLIYEYQYYNCKLIIFFQ